MAHGVCGEGTAPQCFAALRVTPVFADAPRSLPVLLVFVLMNCLLDCVLHADGTRAVCVRVSERAAWAFLCQEGHGCSCAQTGLYAFHRIIILVDMQPATCKMLRVAKMNTRTHMHTHSCTRTRTRTRTCTRTHAHAHAHAHAHTHKGCAVWGAVPRGRVRVRGGDGGGHAVRESRRLLGIQATRGA